MFGFDFADIFVKKVRSQICPRICNALKNSKFCPPLDKCTVGLQSNTKRSNFVVVQRNSSQIGNLTYSESDNSDKGASTEIHNHILKPTIPLWGGEYWYSLTSCGPQDSARKGWVLVFMNIYWYRHRYSQCAVHIVVNHCLIHKKFNNTRTVVQMKFLLATILVYCEVFVQCTLLCGVWFTVRKVNKLSHQPYVGPISDLQYSTTGLKYIRPIVH